jgi:hypothetical protein
MMSFSSFEVFGNSEIISKNGVGVEALNIKIDKGTEKSDAIMEEVATLRSQMNNLATIITGMNTIVNRGVIKKVQRGTAASQGDQINITISMIDPLKSTVNLYGDAGLSETMNCFALPYVRSLTSTTLSIDSFGTDWDSATISWEVVEYY